MAGQVLQSARQLAFDELFDSFQVEDRLAIDDSFPEQFADELSRREAFNKHLYRPNTYLHKWWARRCGSTFRTILKQLVSDPGRRDYYAAGGLSGKIVLDPMMGGATTLHEAIRLGASVIGADIDPIPVVQARATLSQVPLEALQAAFERFAGALYDRIGEYFWTECPHCDLILDSHYTLYGVRKACACREVVQVEQYDLRHEAGRVLRIWPDNWQIGDGPTAPVGPARGQRLVVKAETACPACGEKYRDLLDIPFYGRYVPIAVVGHCPEHGLFYRPPAAADLARLRGADALRVTLDFGPAAGFAVKDGPKSGDLLRRNVRSYLDLFSSRQLLYLYHAIDLLAGEQAAIKLNLALLVSTSLEFNAMLCGYKGWFSHRPGAIRHVFGLHAYSFQYTALENNPVNRQEASGNLRQLFHDRIVRGRRWAVAPVERRVEPNGAARLVRIPGELDGGVEVFDQTGLAGQSQAFWLIHGDSRRLPVADRSMDFIVTDPPYYDSVQYSDLAAFFRVWLARLLPGELDWTYDESACAVAAQTAVEDTGFLAVLSGIFRECGRLLKPGSGRLVFTFHHWDPNAWAELTLALRHAGFRLVNTYVVFSENPISVHIANLNALKHDTILVLALADHAPADRWQPLERIETADSETFCRQCGAALGWLLDSKYTLAEVRYIWKNLVRGR